MGSKPKILVVDDELPIRRTLRLVLGAHGYAIQEAATGQQALDAVEREAFDLIILDLILPEVAGVDVCTRLRAWNHTPIIVLSAIGEDAVKINALHAGADDYITKPFNTAELLARVESTLRRVAWAAEPLAVLHAAHGDLSIDLEQRRVTRGGVAVHLTPLEYEILAFLARNPGRVITHEHLLRSVMGAGYEDATGSLRVHILNLRRKIELVPARPRILLTEPGVGYRLKLE